MSYSSIRGRDYLLQENKMKTFLLPGFDAENIYTGAKLEGGIGGVTPPKIRIIWIGRANPLDWQSNQIF
jgi:hypothetical protein